MTPPAPDRRPDPRPGDDLLRDADAAPPTFAREMLDFLRHNRKWWLLPIILVLLLFGALLVLGGTVAAPFIYTLF